MSEFNPEGRNEVELTIRKKIRSAKKLTTALAVTALALGTAYGLPGVDKYRRTMGAVELGVIFGGAIGAAKKRRETHIDCKKIVNEYYASLGRGEAFPIRNTPTKEQILNPPEHEPVYVPLLDEGRGVVANSAVFTGSASVPDAFSANHSVQSDVATVTIGLGLGYLGYSIYAGSQQRMDEAQEEYLTALAHA